MEESKAPWTEYYTRRAQDRSFTMALHVTAFDGKKEVALEAEGCPLGSDRSGCTVFLGIGRRFAVPLPFPSLFEGIITYNTPSKAKWRNKEGFWELEWAKQWMYSFFMNWIQWPELLLSYQQPAEGTDGDQKLSKADLWGPGLQCTGRGRDPGPHAGWKTKGINWLAVWGDQGYLCKFLWWPWPLRLVLC